MLNLADFIIKNKVGLKPPVKTFKNTASQTELDKKECCICFESEYITYTNCNHIICCNCLISLPNLSCPMCRKTLILPKEIRKTIMNKNKLRDRISNNQVLDVENQEQFPPL